jgi:hypothetical protein
MRATHLIKSLLSGKRLSLENTHRLPIYAPISGSSNARPSWNTRPTPRAPDKCGLRPHFGECAPTADSASGDFFRQVPPLPVAPAVGRIEILGNLMLK